MTKKIIFMGTPQFSVPILQSLIDSEYEVVGVVSQPDKLVGRKKILTMSPVKQLALQHHIKVFQPEKLVKSKELEQLLAMDIDLIVSAAYGQFLPTALLNHPKYRSINVHASLLPKYRGGAPIQYALMNGDSQTGVSIIYMENKMDAGNIIAQKKIIIEDTDNVATLFEKLSIIGRDLLIDTLPKFFNNDITPIVQDEKYVVFSPTIKKEEEKIDWTKEACTIRNHIRAMNTWPGAYTLLKGQRFKIWESTVSDIMHNAPVGTIIEKSKHTLIVACGQQTTLNLTVVQPAGKTKMTIEEFNRGIGNKLEVNDRLG